MRDSRRETESEGEGKTERGGVDRAIDVSGWRSK